jgi:phosphate transport system permease protein
VAVALDPRRPLTPSGNLRRRQIKSRIMERSAMGAALLAVAVLGVVIASVAAKGISQLSIDFLTKAPPAGFGEAGGGIAPAIVGSAVIVAFAGVMAVPLGVLIAVYLSEFAKPRSSQGIRLALDLLNGLPSIVIGVFVFGLLVVGHYQTGFAGSFALAIIMLPLIARSTTEVLALVPQAQRDAAQALGISRWRTTLGVVLPAVLGGIITGTVLAVARAAGETAPLILVCADFGTSTSVNLFGQTALPNIPVSIFQLSESPVPSDHARAWGAALVLMVFILIANITARTLFNRSRAKLAR